jgi:hypothetical protein
MAPFLVSNRLSRAPFGEPHTMTGVSSTRSIPTVAVPGLLRWPTAGSRKRPIHGHAGRHTQAEADIGENPLAPARGLVVGLASALILWVLIGLAIWALVAVT